MFFIGPPWNQDKSGHIAPLYPPYYLSRMLEPPPGLASSIEDSLATIVRRGQTNQLFTALYAAHCTPDSSLQTILSTVHQISDCTPECPLYTRLLLVVHQTCPRPDFVPCQ